MGVSHGEWSFLPMGPMWLHGLVHSPPPPEPLRLCRLEGQVRPRDRALDTFFQGKVFPRLRKRSPQGSAESTSSDKEDDEATDYVFRIIYPGMQSEFGKTPWPRAPGIHLGADPGNNSRYLELEDERASSGGGLESES